MSEGSPLESVNCILCGSVEHDLLIECEDLRYETTREQFRVVRCRGCGLAYLNPRPPKSEIGSYYPDNYRTRETLTPADLEKRLQRYLRKRTTLLKNPWLLPLRPGMKALDIGCGSGEVLLLFRERGVEGHGMDIDEGNIGRLRGEFGFNATVGDIDARTHFEDHTFDLVVMRHSLEHTFNPLHALKEVNRILRPGGTLVIGVPNIESVVSGVTGKYWADLDLPRHLFQFSPATVSRLLRDAGFSVDRLHHETKVSRKSLKKWLRSTPLGFIPVPRALSRAMGLLFALLGRGEWIVLFSSKKEEV